MMQHRKGTRISRDYAVCLLNHTHRTHWWAYTSSGGGHMLSLPLSDDDYRTEKNIRVWLCPGNETTTAVPYL